MNMQTSKREQYEEKMKAQLQEWNAELDKMQAKLKQADAGTRLKAQEQLEKLIAKVVVFVNVSTASLS